MCVISYIIMRDYFDHRQSQILNIKCYSKKISVLSKYIYLKNQFHLYGLISSCYIKQILFGISRQIKSIETHCEWKYSGERIFGYGCQIHSWPDNNPPPDPSRSTKRRSLFPSDFGGTLNHQPRLEYPH